MNAGISQLVGLTLIRATKVSDDRIEFISKDGRQFAMFHSQDCCEHVYIESITGDLGDLVGTPILKADEVCSTEQQEGQKVDEYEDSFTWTFYKLATIKGYVDIRWFGSSNGFYSESVDFEETK